MEIGASSYHRFLEGDQTGFDELIALYQYNLIFFIQRYVKNVTVAEDLAEDAFVELLVHKNRFNFTCSLKTYLFTIGRNKALNYLKRQKFHSPLDFESLDIVDPDILHIENKLLKEETAQHIHKALQQIKKEYSIALHLVYFESLTYEEAARVMGKNSKQIENLVYRGKKAMKIFLEKEVCV